VRINSAASQTGQLLVVVDFDFEELKAVLVLEADVEASGGAGQDGNGVAGRTGCRG